MKSLELFIERVIPASRIAFVDRVSAMTKQINKNKPPLASES